MVKICLPFHATSQYQLILLQTNYMFSLVTRSFPAALSRRRARNDLHKAGQYHTLMNCRKHVVALPGNNCRFSMWQLNRSISLFDELSQTRSRFTRQNVHIFNVAAVFTLTTRVPEDVRNVIVVLLC